MRDGYAVDYVDCDVCGLRCADGAGMASHVRAHAREFPARGLKQDCPHHRWDDHGRPIPSAGYCGPLCAMRPKRRSGCP